MNPKSIVMSLAIVLAGAAAVLYVSSSTSPVATILTSSNQVAQVAGSLGTGLSVYLPLDGNATDASGNGANGSVSGSSWTSGKIGQAYSAGTLSVPSFKTTSSAVSIS